MNASQLNNAQEIFDVVNEQDQVIGQATRQECHTNSSLIHRAVGVFLVNNKGQILLQKRSQLKDLNPGKWTLSASGHIDAGDSYDETIVREIKEELGIEIKQQLTSIGKRLIKDHQQTEMGQVYIALFDGEFQVDPKEVEKVQWFDLAAIYQLAAQKRLLLTPGCDFVLRDAEYVQKIRKICLQTVALQRKIIAVDRKDKEGGPLGKVEAHLGDAKLHRAFTAVLTNKADEILVTRRSLKKPLWPTYWDVSFSSHPWVGEAIEESVERRAVEELGVLIQKPELLFKSEYHVRWSEVFSEWEVNHYFKAQVLSEAVIPGRELLLNNEEISDYKWVNKEALRKWLQEKPEEFVPWVTLVLENNFLEKI